MPIKFRQRTTFDPARAAAKSVPGKVAMKKLGERIADHIRKRTRSGRDERGRPFKPYSAAYAKRKGSAKVDLTLSGDMLDDIQPLNVTDKSVRVGNKSDKLADRAAYNEKRDSPTSKSARHFMGVTKAELRKQAKGTFKKR